MGIPIYQVDVFTHDNLRGNSAAVCLLDSWLPDSTLQEIAEENNLAETAFILPLGDHYAIRWFTPTDEVDLCGHATIAAAFTLFERQEARNGIVFFSSQSGNISVKRNGDLYQIDLPTWHADACEIPKGIEKALGVKPIEAFRADKDLFIVLESEADILAAKPNFEALLPFSERGVVITAPGDEYDFVSRAFFPKIGINEDAVTGSTHAALAPYWSQRLGHKNLIAKQLSTRGGHIECQVRGDRVLVSGKAELYMTGEIIWDGEKMRRPAPYQRAA